MCVSIYVHTHRYTYIRTDIHTYTHIHPPTHKMSKNFKHSKNTKKTHKLSNNYNTTGADDDDDDEYTYLQNDKQDTKHQRDLARLDQQRKNWGKNRDDYYQSDTHNFDTNTIDTEAIREEENEIRRLQHEQAKQLQQMDLGLDALIGGAGKKNKKQTKSAKSSSASSASSSTTTTYTTEQKLQIVLERSPELLGVTSQFFTYSSQCDDILQLFDIVPELKQIINTVPIFSLLRLRQQLLLNYSVCILFYLYLQSKCTPSITAHPVMAQMVNLQTLLELQQTQFDVVVAVALSSRPVG